MTPPALSEDQIAQFWRDGFLVAPSGVTTDQLEALRAEFDGWVDESRAHDGPYGETLDGRARFDVQPGHCADKPALRRVSAPSDISDVCREVAFDSPMVDFVASLIGPDVKLHHTKINSKLPGAATEVKWHQDFPFVPHSNTDVITALLMLDDVTETNGPLEVAPGSHTGPIHSLWQDGRFTGAVTDEVAAPMKRDSVSCVGDAGSVCLMHTKLLHGSAPNRSTRPRTLLISVYSAADAIPCAASPVPTADEGRVVRGSDRGRIRTESYEIDAPEFPRGASFFAQQEQNQGNP